MNQQKVIAEIVHTQEVTSGFFLMKLQSSDLAHNARPGQFIMLKTCESTDPLLRRPFSLCGVTEDYVEILYTVRGRGTRAMSDWTPGMAVDVMGPLGNGFRIPATLETAYLIAGGIGIAPLLFLVCYLTNKFAPVSINMLMGGKSAKDIALLKHFDLSGCSNVCVATEDGTQGFHGMVAELLLDHLKQASELSASKLSIFGCGPFGLSKALANIAARYGIACQLSLESRMACGTGACLGCVLKSGAGGASSMYKRVCADGPVFDSTEIDWDIMG